MPAPGHSPSLCPDPFLDNPAAVLHHLPLALDKHLSAHSGVVGAAPALTLARRAPVAEEGAAPLLLQQGDCSTADQALLAASMAPSMCCKRRVERKAGSSLCWSHRAGGAPYQPWLQGSPPYGEYLHTAAHHALGMMLTPRCCKQGQSRLPAVGVENGGHEAPVHQPPMQPHTQQWVLPSQGCLLGAGSHRAVSPKGCWC